MMLLEPAAIYPTGVSADAFADVGYAVLPGLISADETEELSSLFPELGGRASSVVSPGTSPARIHANERTLVVHEPFRRLLVRQRLVEALDVILGSDWYLIAFETIEIPAGKGKVRDWHCDFHFPAAETIVVNTGIYLQDMTLDRGPLYVIPGSHRRNREPREDEVESPLPGELPLALSAGSGVVFHGRLWHTASLNASPLPRRAVFAYFGHRWVRRMDDYYQQPLPDEILSSADGLTRRLFGLDGGSLVHGPTYTGDNADWR